MRRRSPRRRRAAGAAAQSGRGQRRAQPSRGDRNRCAGEPIRLFTTNRWVTGETWYSGADIIAMLDRFAIDLARPSWLLNRWIGAIVRLFRPQIIELIRSRDQAIMSWRRRHRGKVHVFEDRRLEVASSQDIDLEEQLPPRHARPPPRGVSAGLTIPTVGPARLIKH